MKKLITICLFMATSFTVNAQKLSGSLGSYAHNNVCNRYTNLNWEISYKFEKRTDGIYLTYYNPKVIVVQNALYATAEKNYSKQELGLSVWPQNYDPSSLNVSIDCRLPNGKVELSGASFSSSDPYKTYEDWVCAPTFNGQEVNLSGFTLSIRKASYNPQPVEELDAIIKAKESKTPNTSNTTAQNSGSNNSLTSQTSSTEATSQIPSLESQYAKLGIPANTPTYTKQEVTKQFVTQAAVLGSEFVNDWNSNYDKKMARLQTESNERVLQSAQRQSKRFEFYYNQLINLANNGNETAQIILYLESDNYLQKKVPLREVWFKKALENKNPIALLTQVNEETYQGNNKEVLHELAESGNLDAMIMLGLWYSQKNKVNLFWKSTIYGCKQRQMRGGDNEELAIKYLTLAAEKGSPNAMYHLAMVYKYGTPIPKNTYMSKVYKYGKSIPEKSYMIQFNIDKNEKLAYEWLLKSVLPEYKESVYQTHHVTNKFWEGSCFESGSYFELAEIYEKGKIVPKDITKATELRKLGRERDEYIMKTRGERIAE